MLLLLKILGFIAVFTIFVLGILFLIGIYGIYEERKLAEEAEFIKRAQMREEELNRYQRVLDFKNNIYDLNENTGALYANGFIFIEKSILNVQGYELTMLKERENGSTLVIFLNKNNMRFMTANACNSDKFYLGGKTYSLIDLMAPLVVETIE